MNAIIYDCHGLVNGSLLDCLDLYVYCRSVNIPLVFILMNDKNVKNTLQCIRRLFYERHYEEYVNPCIIDEIKIYNRLDLILIHKVVVFDYSTFNYIAPFIKKGNVIFVSNVLKTELSLIVNNLKDNVSLWGEDSYNFYTQVSYTQKLLLPMIKECKTVPLIVCPGLLEEEMLRSLYLWKDFTLPKKYLYRNYNSYTPLWSNFDRLIYLQSPKLYDRKPRIIYECRAYKMPVSYHRCSLRDVDGSTIRYNDSSKREYLETDVLVEYLK